MQTTFANNVNPWKLTEPAKEPMNPVKKIPAYKKDKSGRVKASKLVISDVPYTIPPKSKYRAVFERLKVGQCVECEQKDAEKVWAAMNSYFRHKAIVKMSSVCEDGIGRVWYLGDK